MPACLPACLQVSHCDNQRAHYLRKLEAVRVALSPVFDANSVDTAAKRFRQLLSAAAHRADAAEFLRRRGHQRALQPWLSATRAEAEGLRLSPAAAATDDPSQTTAPTNAPNANANANGNGSVRTSTTTTTTTTWDPRWDAVTPTDLAQLDPIKVIYISACAMPTCSARVCAWGRLYQACST